MKFANRSKYALDEPFLVKSNEPIYKYLSFFQLVDMLENKKLYLQKVGLWDDPSEGSGYVSFHEYVFTKATGATVDPVVSDDEFRKSVKKRYPFGTSWSFLPESDAMWRIYSQDKMGIQIQTTVEKLEGVLSMSEFPKEQILIVKTQLADRGCSAEVLNRYSEIERYFDMKYVVGRVVYSPTDNRNNITFDQSDLNGSLSEHAHFEEFLKKREAFKHEEEVRGLVNFFSDNINSRGNSLSCQWTIEDIMIALTKEKKSHAPIDNNFIEAVKIDPRADDWVVQTIKSYCESKKITNVERSDLYGK